MLTRERQFGTDQTKTLISSPSQRYRLVAHMVHTGCVYMLLTVNYSSLPLSSLPFISPLSSSLTVFTFIFPSLLLLSPSSLLSPPTTLFHYSPPLPTCPHPHFSLSPSLLLPFLTLPPPLLPSSPPLQNVPVSDEDVHTPLQQGGYEGRGGGGGEEEEQEEPNYALPPDAREVKVDSIG